MYRPPVGRSTLIFALVVFLTTLSGFAQAPQEKPAEALPAPPAPLAPQSPKAPQQPLPDGKALIAKFVEASGGKAAFDAIKNRVSKGTLDLPAQAVKFGVTAYEARPNSSYVTLDGKEMGKIERGSKADFAWENSVMTGASIKKDQEKIDSLREATMDKYVYCTPMFSKIETAGIENVAEKPCYKVVGTFPEGGTETMFYDKDSGLILRAALTFHSAMGEIPVVRTFSDYRKVDGVLLPFETRDLVMGTEAVARMDTVEQNVEMPETRFDAPPAVQDLLKKPAAPSAPATPAPVTAKPGIQPAEGADPLTPQEPAGVREPEHAGSEPPKKP